MGIFDKLFRRNKNVETEEVEKVDLHDGPGRGNH